MNLLFYFYANSRNLSFIKRQTLLKHLIYIFAFLLLPSCQNKVEKDGINKGAVQLNEKTLQIY